MFVTDNLKCRDRDYVMYAHRTILYKSSDLIAMYIHRISRIRL